MIEKQVREEWSYAARKTKTGQANAYRSSFSIISVLLARIFAPRGSLISYGGKEPNWMRQRYWELFKSCFEAVESQTQDADAAALE